MTQPNVFISNDPVAVTPDELLPHSERVRESTHVVRTPSGHIGVAFDGEIAPTAPNGVQHPQWLATLPPVYPEWLGDRRFNEVHGVRFPYVAGAMANGIASPELVIAMARAKMLAFYGAAGLGLDRIKADLDQISRAVDPDAIWGANLIHAPIEPELEAATAQLFLDRQVNRVSASAYMNLTLPVVHYSAAGLSAAPDG